MKEKNAQNLVTLSLFNAMYAVNSEHTIVGNSNMDTIHPHFYILFLANEK